MDIRTDTRHTKGLDMKGDACIMDTEQVTYMTLVEIITKGIMKE